MASYTNYTPGARGVNLKSGQTVWIEPGETADIDAKQIVGELPDFGTKPSADAAADQAASDAELAAAKSEIEALKAQIADLTKK